MRVYKYNPHTCAPQPQHPNLAEIRRNDYNTHTKQKHHATYVLFSHTCRTPTFTPPSIHANRKHMNHSCMQTQLHIFMRDNCTTAHTYTYSAHIHMQRWHTYTHAALTHIHTQTNARDAHTQLTCMGYTYKHAHTRQMHVRHMHTQLTGMRRTHSSCMRHIQACCIYTYKRQNNHARHVCVHQTRFHIHARFRS